ncbi:hydrogenase maturation nickel metallochaperone HypA [Curtanaerobium respiraculi]|uniref:hydrogenase maturation nickel metallochaperone HypA/HybF n=1 Tax=Curtanaerobium respiraculi TaxID=2949669 RepID=UPI0024B34375|nr:hydrogenase maturation nickel metallochaperone HypA [Curtanaerobium respiraculi]
MHELGLMTSVMDAVRGAALEAGATKVISIDISVGEMTEAIEECLTFAYDALAEQEELFHGSKLNLKMVKPRSRCLECGAEYGHDRFHMSCPKCGSFATELIAGRDLTIDRVEIETPD